MPDYDLNDLDLQNLEESFILQSPSSEVNNIVVSSDTGYLNDVQKNFEAVPKVGILNQDYELQAYQTSSIDRQICSAPTEISLDYYISDFDVQDPAQTVWAYLGYFKGQILKKY